MDELKEFAAFINPLLFIEGEDSGLLNRGVVPAYEAIVKYFCRPIEDPNPERVIARYHEIKQGAERLFAVPLEENILLKLIWPLKHAICSYMVGNYLGTISLCGLVAEMASILLFKISPIFINNRRFNEEDQKKIFGRTFERLSQGRRIEILHGYNIIHEDQAKALKLITDKRNPYLHRFDQDHTLLAGEAKEAFNATVSFIVDVIGQGVDSQGRILLSPKLLKYLEDAGLLEIPKQA